MTISGLCTFLDITRQTWEPSGQWKVFLTSHHERKRSSTTRNFLAQPLTFSTLTSSPVIWASKEQSQVEDVTPDKGDRDKRRSRIKELFNRGTGRDS
ncbi:hypothetical protein ACVXHA_07080 [Escherichia coli]